MKKSSLVMILALVGMVGCGYGKQAKLPDLRHPAEGSPCNIQAWASTAGESYNCVNGKWINNNPGFIMGADGSEPVIHEGIHQKCPDKGCDDREFYRDAYPNVSSGGYAVIGADKPAKKPKANKLQAMTGDPYHPGSGWNFEMKGSHVVWLKDGGYLCEANDGSQNNSCREVEQGEIDWHAAHPEDYTRSFYKSIEKAK